MSDVKTPAPAKAKAEATADQLLDKVTAEVARRVRELEGNRMQECEFKRTLYVATAHENTQPEDLLDPAYWSHVAERLRPWDKIEARADDGSWYAEFLVLETSRRWARVHLLFKADLTTADVSLTAAMLDEFEVTHRGPERQWSVLRRSDSAMVHEGEQTRAGAYTWLANRIKAGI